MCLCRAWTVRWSRGTVTDWTASVEKATTKQTRENCNLSTVSSEVETFRLIEVHYDDVRLYTSCMQSCA